jgi:hypothetical protein
MDTDVDMAAPASNTWVPPQGNRQRTAPWLTRDGGQDNLPDTPHAQDKNKIHRAAVPAAPMSATCSSMPPMPMPDAALCTKDNIPDFECEWAELQAAGQRPGTELEIEMMDDDRGVAKLKLSNEDLKLKDTVAAALRLPVDESIGRGKNNWVVWVAMAECWQCRQKKHRHEFTYEAQCVLARRLRRCVIQDTLWTKAGKTVAKCCTCKDGDYMAQNPKSQILELTTGTNATYSVSLEMTVTIRRHGREVAKGSGLIVRDSSHQTPTKQLDQEAYGSAWVSLQRYRDRENFQRGPERGESPGGDE